MSKLCKNPFPVKFHEDTRLWLHREAQRKSISVNEVIRRAVEKSRSSVVFSNEEASLVYLSLTDRLKATKISNANFKTINALVSRFHEVIK